MKRLPKGLSIVNHNGLTIAQLYQTKIVIIDHVNNTVQLNSGGWNTNHTKKCINLVLNKHEIYLYQEKFNWYVNINNTKHSFTDSMVLNLNKVA